jgi:cobalamin biosynthesis protein CobD/CbiB
MSELAFKAALFVAIWLPVLGIIQIINAYQRNRHRKNPKWKEFRWGGANCFISVILYIYLMFSVGWVTAISGVVALVILSSFLFFG